MHWGTPIWAIRKDTIPYLSPPASAGKNRLQPAHCRGPRSTSLAEFLISIRRVRDVRKCRPANGKGRPRIITKGEISGCNSGQVVPRTCPHLFRDFACAGNRAMRHAMDLDGHLAALGPSLDTAPGGGFKCRRRADQ